MNHKTLADPVQLLSTQGIPVEAGTRTERELVFRRSYSESKGFSHKTPYMRAKHVISIQGVLCLGVSRLLVCVYVPDDIVRQTNNLITCSLCHLGEAFSFGLVLECIGREVDS